MKAKQKSLRRTRYRRVLPQYQTCRKTIIFRSNSFKIEFLGTAYVIVSYAQINNGSLSFIEKQFFIGRRSCIWDNKELIRYLKKLHEDGIKLPEVVISIIDSHAVGLAEKAIQHGMFSCLREDEGVYPPFRLNKVSHPLRVKQLPNIKLNHVNRKRRK